MDKAGKRPFQNEFYKANHFSEGLAPVIPGAESNLWGYINKSGQVAIAPAYLNVGFFGEGLSCVKTVDGKWIIIDTSGKMVIDFKYDMVTPFKNGIAEVLLGGKIGYIDKTGKYIWEPK